MPNPWKTIVDKVLYKTLRPNAIILSTPSPLSSLRKNSIHNPRKKIKNIVDKFITSWDIKIKETKLQTVNIDSIDEFSSL